MNEIAEITKNLDDPWWRITSGQLYKILVKDDENGEEGGLLIPFHPNPEQIELLENLHYRNVILKARQLGFTTAIAIYLLDCALFRDNVRAGVVAHTEDAAKKIFRDKYKIAYDNLPSALRSAMPLERDSADELLFAHNNSSVKVSTSMRSATLQYLHVSEFGKICAQFPKRAEEVVTGTIPALASNGIYFEESTAEGREGYFYKRVTKSRKNTGKLNKKQYKLHFFAWWRCKDYRLNPEGIAISPDEHDYFDSVEQEIGQEIDLWQRAWYIATRDEDMAGEEEKMWQEYPSTIDESFKKSAKGAYFAKQLLKTRKDKRITQVPPQDGHVVNTFWDIGSNDGTAIWLHQRVGMKDLIIGFIECWDEPYSYYVNELNQWRDDNNMVWGNHYLPHDANHVRQGEKANLKPKQMLQNLGLRNILIVPKIGEKLDAINALRKIFKNLWFDESACKNGIMHLDEYRQKWNESNQCFTGQPEKNTGHSEAADALMQLAQMYDQINKPPKTKPKRRQKRQTSWMG